jgi:hypothetical protein
MTKRTYTVLATRMVVGLGPVDETPFYTQARPYPERGFWAAEDKPPNGLPSLGLVPLNVLEVVC